MSKWMQVVFLYRNVYIKRRDDAVGWLVTFLPDSDPKMLMPVLTSESAKRG